MSDAGELTSALEAVRSKVNRHGELHLDRALTQILLHWLEVEAKERALIQKLVSDLMEAFKIDPETK